MTWNTRYDYDINTHGGDNDILSLPWSYLSLNDYYHRCICSILRPGFFKAVQLTLQVREDGVATAGVPCHSFVYMNSGTAITWMMGVIFVICFIKPSTLDQSSWYTGFNMAYVCK